MSSQPRILAFSGSLRAASFNQQLVKVAAGGATKAGALVTVIHLKEFPLPVFDEDLERSQGLPENARKLKDLFFSHQGLLIACPEYNSSMTAALKNALDWVSRPAPGEGPLQAYDGKVAALLAASPGALGGLRGLVSVRSLLSNIKVIVLPEQVAVPKAHEAFDAVGNLKDPKQQASVEGVGAALAKVVTRLNA
jgi:chromate reductase, NAD(P)H dehydrogenase (quinone)